MAIGSAMVKKNAANIGLNVVTTFPIVMLGRMADLSLYLDQREYTHIDID